MMEKDSSERDYKEMMTLTKLSWKGRSLYTIDRVEYTTRERDFIFVYIGDMFFSCRGDLYSIIGNNVEEVSVRRLYELRDRYGEYYERRRRRGGEDREFLEVYLVEGDDRISDFEVHPNINELYCLMLESASYVDLVDDNPQCPRVQSSLYSRRALEILSVSTLCSRLEKPSRDLYVKVDRFEYLIC